MQLLRRAVRSAGVAALVAGGLIAVSPGALADPGWSIQATPDPAAFNATLTGVDCESTTACVAVGLASGPDGSDRPIAEHWNGNAWTTDGVPTPAGAGGYLTDISCAPGTATRCMAIGGEDGNGHPLAEVWDGSTWTEITPPITPAGGGRFYGVSCPAVGTCIAVGGRDVSGTTLAEVWDGTSWSMQHTPNAANTYYGGYNEVACPSATVCLAVGFEDTTEGLQPLATLWSGGTWHAETVPGPEGASGVGLAGVDCTTPTDCEAVGFAQSKKPSGDTEQGPVAETWDGSQLSASSVPSPAGLSDGQLVSVSCTGSAVCRAVGSAENSSGSAVAVAADLQGGTWTDQAVQLPAGSRQSVLAATQCVTETFCIAVGHVELDAGDGLTLAEQSAGGAWSTQATPAVTQPDRLYAIACSTASSCTSVGQVDGAPGLAVAQRWDGDSWAVTSLPWVPGAATGVSCPSSCRAVGHRTNKFHRAHPVSSWGTDGSRLKSAPLPAGAVAGSFAAVSCLHGNACEAVGYWRDNSSVTHPLVESFDGARWTAQSAADPDGSGITLLAVSCPAASSCLAVGKDAADQPVAEVEDGSTWQLTAAPPTAGSATGTLDGVSCRSTTSCAAVGTATTDRGILLDTYSAGTWTHRAVTVPPGTTSASLAGVSCPPGTTTCTAVGTAANGSASVPVAVRGSAANWTGSLLPAPDGASAAALNGVACLDATDCEAAGYWTDSAGVDHTLAERFG